MSKQIFKKFGKQLGVLIENQQALAQTVDAIILAQNKSGVLVMTLLQMLIEKGVLDKKEIEDRMDANEKLALDSDGGCQIELSSLLQVPEDD